MTLNKPDFDFRKSLGTLETDITIDPSLGLTSFTLQGLGKESHYIKPNRRKYIRRILLNKNKLKNLKPQSVNLPMKTNISINESLCWHSKKLAQM